MDGEECPTEQFILEGQAKTLASRTGLSEMLQHVATNGFQNIPHGWSWLADREREIYEFRKGDLRLFYFKGVGNEIAICTVGVLKQGPKADKAAVNRAAQLRKDYLAAQKDNSYEVVKDEDEQ